MNPTILIVVPDLFFATRIETTARALDVRTESAEVANALERCRAAVPSLILLDLHAPGAPIDLARALKAEPRTRAIPIVAFHSHVDRERRDAALAAGIDRVMPRSAFTAKLAEILGNLIPK